MSRETTALVLREINGPFTLETIRLNTLRPDEALVDIHATGVCRIDLLCASGVIPAPTPAIFGHEGAGVVVETGSGVDEVSAGDKVLLSYAFCKTCSQCKSGHLPYCENSVTLKLGCRRSDGTSALALSDGSKLHGHYFGQSSFSRLAVVSSSSLVKVPQETPLDLFAPLGCGLQTSAGTILNTLNVQEGSTVAFFGVGSVGLSAIMASRIVKAKEIIAVDIPPSRLELAKGSGATKTINSRVVDVLEAIKKLCPPAGVQFALDCSGVLKVVETMIDSLGVHGRACSVGAPKVGKRASVEIFCYIIMGKQYMECAQGESIAREMAPCLINKQREGRYPLEKFIAHYDANDISVAIKDMKEGRKFKPALKWQ